MIKIVGENLNEGIVLIRLTKGQILTKSYIRDKVYEARSNFSYVKFILHNGVYITVNFNRDFTISIATNSRDLGFYTQLQNVQRTYTDFRLIEFLFRWIPLLNK